MRITIKEQISIYKTHAKPQGRDKNIGVLRPDFNFLATNIHKECSDGNQNNKKGNGLTKRSHTK